MPPVTPSPALKLKLKPRLPVLIIGSGLGGLTLAHSLQRSGIPYRLFERDASMSGRAQGYRISVDEGGASGLRAAVSSDVWERFERTCAKQFPPGGRLDARSGGVLGKGVVGLVLAGGWGMLGEMGARWVRGRWGRVTISGLLVWISSFFRQTSTANSTLKVPQGATKSYQVDRRVLRSILLASQSEHITYSSTFTSYTHTPGSGSNSGFITAQFQDGSTVEGSLLVGADGTNSNVAKQLVGQKARPINMGVRIIYGKTLITDEIEKKLHPVLKHGTSFVVEPHAMGEGVGNKLLLVQECMRFNRETGADVEVILKDYIFWALAGRKEIFEPYLQNQNQNQNTDPHDSLDPGHIALKLTSTWHPSIRLIQETQSHSETAILRMTSSSTTGLPYWPTDKRVTVLGDAIHCMPPTGGQGANAAMHDAALLGMALKRNHERGSWEGEGNEGWDVETIRAYEKGVRDNIGDVVGLACIGAKRIMGADMP